MRTKIWARPFVTRIKAFAALRIAAKLVNDEELVRPSDGIPSQIGHARAGRDSSSTKIFPLQINLIDGEWRTLVLPLVIATLLAVPFVLFSMFNGMAWFDDEGTLLVGFRSLLDGQRMYDDIFSLYGPLYNALYGLIYVVLGVPLTHTADRLIAAVLWLSYSAGFAAFCHRLTRSVPTTLFAYVLVLIWLKPLRESPGHPEELCLLLLATVLLIACAIERSRNSAALAAIGAAVAGLALTKINVGVFVGGGVVLALLRITTRGAWTRIATPLVATALLLLPFVVEGLLFDFEWVKVYSIFSELVISAALLTFLTIPRQSILRPTDWWVIAAGGSVACLTTVGGMMLAGSSGLAILHAMLPQAADFMRNWYVPLYIGLPGMLSALASLVTALAYCISRSSTRLRSYGDLGGAVLKLGFVIVAVTLLGHPGMAFRLLVPFCWLLAVPPAGLPWRHAMARGMVSLIGATMSLYPFPVAGSQVSIGSVLPIMAVPVLAYDLIQAVQQREAVKRLLVSSQLSLLTVFAVLSIGAALTLRSALAYWQRVPLDLPGTSLIRVDEPRAADLRWVTEQLRSCASSYSMPGLWSFAFWAGHSPLTAQNSNDVLAFIKPDQQQRIVQKLSQKAGLCVVYNPTYLRTFDRGQIQADPPLVHYLHTSLVPVAQRSGFVILKQAASAPPRYPE